MIAGAGNIPEAFACIPVDQSIAMIISEAGREQRFASLRNPSHAMRIGTYVQRAQLPLPRVQEERVLVGAARVRTQQRAGSFGRCKRRMDRMIAIHPEAEFAAGA